MITTDTHVFFYTGIYSNWQRCSFTDPVNGITFANSEQCFMYYKAKFFHDDETANLIVKATHPKENKALGRLIKNYNEEAWKCVRTSFMVYANYLKFSQNPEYKQQLLSTDGKILVEASPVDTIWGIGLDEENPDIYDTSKWQGLNLLGKSLGRVRELLKK